MPFPQEPAGARRILGGWRRSGWLWCCERSCWWCSRLMTKRNSPAGSGRGRRGPVREGYKVVAILLKPSLGLFGLVGRRWALLPHAGSTTGHLISTGDHHTLQHIQVHFGVDFQADFEDVRCHDVTLTWNHTIRKLCFHHPGRVSVIRGNPDLHFEGAGNGPVVITWIGSEHESYSGASLISLVEHCVIFRHDKRLLSPLVYVHNWPTSIWSATKKENRFSFNGNGIMSSFLGQQFYRSTLSLSLYIYIYIYIYICVCVCVCVCVYYLLLESFSHQFSWWFFTGVLVRENLVKSPGLFAVFWPGSIML